MQLLTVLLALAASAAAHYHFCNVGVDGLNFVNGRKPKNFQDNGPIFDLSSADMRCNQLGDAPSVFTVAAGSNLSIYYNQGPWHQGPYQAYMAKVPEGADVKTWDPAGAVFFKVFSSGGYTGGCKYENGNYCFVNTWPNPQPITLPARLPPGDYIFRAEHLALHIPQQPQFYVGCAQVTVTGGDETAKPGPLVAFPGAYHTGDPAIFNNFNYPKPVDYTPPGPAVWTGE